MASESVLGVGLSISVDDPNWRDLGRNIDEAVAAGVDFVELPLQSLDLVVGGRILSERVRDVRAAAAGRGARFTLHGHLGINLMDDVHRLALHREVLGANIEIAAELECCHLVVHSGFTRRGTAQSVDEAYARQREALAGAGDRAQSLGVTICVENIFEFQGVRETALPSELARELARIDHPNVRATFDLSHGYLHSGMLGRDFMSEATALAPFAKHLHVHDSFGRPSDFWTYTPTEALAFGAGDLHLPVGWGTVPFERIASACSFPAGIVADIELQRRYWSELSRTIEATRAFAGQIARRTT